MVEAEEEVQRAGFAALTCSDNEKQRILSVQGTKNDDRDVFV